MEWAGLEISNLELLKKIMNSPTKQPDQEEPIPWKNIPGITSWLLILAQNLSKLDPTSQEIFSSIDKFRDFKHSYDYNIFLPKISCPVLLLRGSEKQGSMMADIDVQLAQEHINHLVHVKFEDVGHGLFIEKAESILQVMTNFLELLRD